MKRKFFAVVLMLALSVSMMGCGAGQEEEAKSSYQYYTAEQTKEAIEGGEEIQLVDIQVEEEWSEHHIKGAISTKAYPVKSDEDKAKVEEVLPQLEGDNPVVVVCPRGGGGAERTVDYLIESGIDSSRVFILENGQAGWPYDELLEK